MCVCVQHRAGWTVRSQQKPGRAPCRSTATSWSTCPLTSPAANTWLTSSRCYQRTRTHRPQTRQCTHSHTSTHMSKYEVRMCPKIIEINLKNTIFLFRLKRNETVMVTGGNATGWSEIISTDSLFSSTYQHLTKMRRDDL